MLTAHRVDDIRTAEAAAEINVATGELMQRAARALAGELSDVPAGDALVVLAGPGDNGGDALYAAAHLLDRGVRVDIACVDPARVHQSGLDAAIAAGATLVDAPTDQRWCLDGMFGIGARPGLSGRAAAWAAWAHDRGATTIAVDVPSGVDVDGGTLPGPHVVAGRTVTFGTYKVALLAGPAAAAAGDVRMVDIGLELGEGVLEAIEATDGDLIAPAIPRANDHKYTRGVVGIAAGSDQYPGAAYLAVAGAQAGTAGMIRFAGPAELGARVVDRAPEVVLEAGRVQAWVVGPGAGDSAGAYLAAVLPSRVSTVIDADAIRAVSVPLDVPGLVTPHAGELASKLGVDRSAVDADPLGYVTRAAEAWGCTVLLKGSRTLVATPGRPTRINLSGTPWLATAGSGDVLAGFAGSLLASGLDPHDAGSLAAFLHGCAAESVGGPLTASDIADTLPRVLTDFARSRS